MKKYKIIFYFILFFCTSCKSQNNNGGKNNKAEANLLNNEALKTSQLTCNKDSLKKSIILFERAIKLDNTVAIFYGNEAEIYCNLKKYQEAIKVINRYLYNFPINLSLETLKGYIYEKKGNMDSAMACYSDALKQYDREIQDDSNNIPIQINRAMLLFFTQGNTEAIMEYNRIANKFPNDKNVKSLRENFYSFERKSYINQLFSDCN